MSTLSLRRNEKSIILNLKDSSPFTISSSPEGWPLSVLESKEFTMSLSVSTSLSYPGRFLEPEAESRATVNRELQQMHSTYGESLEKIDTMMRSEKIEASVNAALTSGRKPRTSTRLTCEGEQLGIGCLRLRA